MSLIGPNLVRGLIVVLIVFVAASGVGVAWIRHENRMLAAELEALRSDRDELRYQWGRLQLEQASLSAHTRIEPLARQHLNMVMPGDTTILRVTPP